VARIVQKFRKLTGIQNYIKAINNITEFKTLIIALYSLVTELDSFDDKKSAWVLKQIALAAAQDAAEDAAAPEASPAGAPADAADAGTAERISVQEAKAISQRIIKRIKKEMN